MVVRFVELKARPTNCLRQPGRLSQLARPSLPLRSGFRPMAVHVALYFVGSRIELDWLRRAGKGITDKW
eukprot:356120-Chlamydomonas_euryale.AAC.13